MALYEYEKVVKTQAQLELVGATIPDANSLLTDANRRLQESKHHWDAHRFSEAYHEDRKRAACVRCALPVRAQWEKAVRGLDTPVASPYAVSFYTLPKHWPMMAEIDKSSVGPNVLPGGDFEMVPERVQESWTQTPPVATLDDVEVAAERVVRVEGGQEGNAAISRGREAVRDVAGQIEGRQTRAGAAGANAGCPDEPEREFATGHTGADQRLGQHSGADHGVAGQLALLYDSAPGSEAAQAIRLTEATPWKKFTVYRRVPASGTINVTIAARPASARCTSTTSASSRASRRGR